MSQENVEIACRYIEAGGPTPDLVGGYWEDDGDYYPVRKFRGEALPRARGDREPHA